MQTDDLDDELKKLQNRYLKKAVMIGYVRKTVEYTKDLLSIFEDPGNFPYLPNGIVRSTGDLYISMTKEVKELNNQVQSDERIITSVASAATSAQVAAETLIELTPMEGRTEKLPQRPRMDYIWIDDQKTGIMNKFIRIDQELAKEYEQILQIEYGTFSDPSRPMLFLARQLFDHAIGILSKDKQVRSFYGKAAEEKVSRRQRLEFVIKTMVKNGSRGEVLLKEISTILETYEILNSAHKRGELDQIKSKKAVFQMVDFLERLIVEIYE
jgi:hypothetical protein